MKIKNIILVIILIFIIAGISAYFFYFEQNKNNPDSPGILINAQDLLEFNNYNDELSPELVDKYLKQFLAAKDMIINSQNSQTEIDPSYWLTIARMKKYINDFQGAEQIYLYLISVDTNNYIPQGNLADLYANYLHNYKKASEHFWLAMEKSQPSAQVVIAYYRNLADIYADKLINQKQEFEKRAEQDLKEKYFGSVDFLTMLAKYYKDINNKEKAINYLEQALVLDPTSQTIKDEIEVLKE
ncbi:tetratricopeptide repeat protein [Patescibacteria group bacterium]|nr:tetratricopeptide repeat protein [Patescibacteria group bacterium]